MLRAGERLRVERIALDAGDNATPRWPVRNGPRHRSPALGPSADRGKCLRSATSSKGRGSVCFVPSVEELNFARPSLATVWPSRWMRSISQVAAMPMACGKTVASPARPTPCNPSLQYVGRNLEPWNGGRCVLQLATFSASERREIKSATRCATGSEGFGISHRRCNNGNSGRGRAQQPACRSGDRCGRSSRGRGGDEARIPRKIVSAHKNNCESFFE